MKYYTLLIALSLFIKNQTYAQQTLSKLDSIFMYLDTTDMSTGILYDKTYRFGKADTFNIINDTAISMHYFRQILLDMKVGSVNLNNSIITLDSLRNMVNADAINNIVPITILNYKYNVIKEYALDSNLMYYSSDNT
ncbi:MAG: hypothetical protein KA954_10780 [Chitinophagales bacterium]|nr:hypothetical protein [Chitinophagales bacterium]MBP8755080.1 hypothetical protein [Chitinophagales bacterium]MBP9190849.1 hypothetical protein [Chitinophagales bacterium]MBP9703698.1 hypothetical protein [Chitinophagales bacterium]